MVSLTQITKIAVHKNDEVDLVVYDSLEVSLTSTEDVNALTVAIFGSNPLQRMFFGAICDVLNRHTSTEYKREHERRSIFCR
mmetsp:Transcript_14230/g.21269  ORF Transcript_14230/g.21269 Transcript_14230/m.21269 type:complete len:82 (-) Transcript_14230:537-782(-)